MRLLVYGNSGSGKSTLARVLAARHALEPLDLDTIVWEPGKIAVQRSPVAILQSLHGFLARRDRWVIEGCYGELVETAAPHCTRLLFLDPGVEACLANNRARPWEPHKYATRQSQDAMLGTLQAWVCDYYVRDDAWSHRRHQRIFDAFDGDKRRLTDTAPADCGDIAA